MEGTTEKYKSLFDAVEEQTGTPSIFDWVPTTTINIPPDDFLIERTLLLVSRRGGLLKLRRCVLTRLYLIRYNKRDTTQPKAILRLRNPRAEPMVDKLRHGFRLHGYGKSHEFYCDSEMDQYEWLQQLKKVCVFYSISRWYKFSHLIGKGNFAKVHLAKSKDTNENFAIKTIEKAVVMKNIKTAQALQKEIDIMRKLDHTRIIKLHEVFENETFIHLVLEYLSGGELFQLLKTKGIYSERDAAIAMSCVLEALAYCHQKNIIHRDLKPENLILVDTSGSLSLKIADFGLATIMKPGRLEMQKCGSPGYVAPEVLNGKGYDTKADVFSAGVILYIFIWNRLTGVSPFHSDSYTGVLYKNKRGVIEYPKEDWANVSLEGKDLVQRMTKINPAERITAAEAQVHNWFKVSGGKTKVLSSALENMKKYHGKGNENRFDVARIKPQFSTMTSSPMTSRLARTNVGAAEHRPSPLDRFVIRPTDGEDPNAKKFSYTAYPKERYQPPSPPPETIDEEADFKDSDIAESSLGTEETPASPQKVKGTNIHPSFLPGSPVPHMLPPTPGPGKLKTLRNINLLATPQRARQPRNRLADKATELANKNKYFSALTGSRKAHINVNTRAKEPLEEEKQVAPVTKNHYFGAQPNARGGYGGFVIPVGNPPFFQLPPQRMEQEPGIGFGVRPSNEGGSSKSRTVYPYTPL